MKSRDAENISKHQSHLSSQYQGYTEDISGKRVFSEYQVRSKVHSLMHESVLAYLKRHKSILDLGCGDGVLTVKFVDYSDRVVGIDVSSGNIIRAKDKLVSLKLPPGTSLEFREGDVCAVSEETASFEVVHSHHVLEHVSDFSLGLLEHKRLATNRIIISLPTALSPIAWTLLGGANFWSFSKSSLPRTAYGFLRVILCWCAGRVGVNERNYAGLTDVPHIFFFPKRIIRKLECNEWEVIKYHPQVVGLPWISRSLSLSTKTSSFGHGTVFVLARR